MTQASRMLRRPTAVLLTLAVALVAALALTLSAGAPRNAEAATTVRINIKDFKYSKSTITVKRGTKIRWTNKDSMKHNVHSDKSGGPKGKLLAKGKSYTWTAKKKGTFSYYCEPHPYMKAKIVVK